MDALDIQKAHLVAQSMDGITTLEFVVDHFDRVLTVTFADTTGAMGEEDVETALTNWRDSHLDTRGIGVRALSEGFHNRNPNITNLYLQILISNPPRDIGAQILYGGPKGEELERLTMSVLFIVGEEGELTPPHVLDLAVAHIPGSKMIRTPACGHFVYFEKPEVFNFEVGRFIGGVFG